MVPTSEAFREGVIVVGAGPHGRVAADILRASGTQLIAFVDDRLELHGSIRSGFPVLGDVNLLLRERFGKSSFVAIGNNHVRTAIAARLREVGIDISNAIYPTSVMMHEVQLGSGNMICPGVIVGVNVTIEDDVVLNTAASVDHDCVIKRGAYLAPGVHAAGGVTIGDLAFIGLGALIGPNVAIGEGAVVGAGSLVLENVSPRTLVMGRPAKTIRKLCEPYDWSRILSGHAAGCVR
jgi:sugar O-acyltransferase (sialic acid O-acetyltransferase NeuD family)